MTGISKLAPVRISCVDYVHPWQPNCTIAHAGLIVEAALYSARTYSAVYVFSLLMRGRRPTGRDLLHTVLGIVRSTAFLTTNSFTFCMFLCIIRRYAGHFNFYTFSFVPSLIGSLCAILIERPSRRGMLALYTSNVASEAVFQMAVDRGWLRPVRGGSVAVFGAGAAALMYVFRQTGAQRQAVGAAKGDSIFEVLRFVVGEEERRISSGPSTSPADGDRATDSNDDDDDDDNATLTSDSARRRPPTGRTAAALQRLAAVRRLVDAYTQLQRLADAAVPAHRTCPHREGCVMYAAARAGRLFGVGVGIQVALRCVLQAGQVWRRGPGHLVRVLGRWETLRLGVFLGGFAGVYRATSCGLRHATDADRPAHAVPAALAASAAFAAYPDTTVALYAAWKAAQIGYGEAERRGWLPHVPHFEIALYCLSTAMLFHVGIMEPLTLRPSYFKFLHSLSGARLVGMNRDCMECYGLDTVNKLAEAMRRTNIVQRPSFAL